MNNQPFGAAIIGNAHAHAVGHLDAIRRSTTWDLIAAAEPNPELLAKAKTNARWDSVAWTSVDALLSDDRIQMVCVETDPFGVPYLTRYARSKPASTPRLTSRRASTFSY